MSDEIEIEDDERDSIKDLRRAADESRKLKAEAELARRELAFLKAGVDTDSKLGKLLLKTYDGELTLEAIRAEAQDLGIGGSGSTVTEVVEEEFERNQSRERFNLANESGISSTESAHPNQIARQAFDAAMRNGDPREVAAGAAFAEIFKAAQRGDERVFIR